MLAGETTTEIRSLYTRCKALGLAVGAGLALGVDDPALAPQAAALRRDIDAAGGGDALRACRQAVLALERLLGDDSPEHLSEARATQRAMRRAVWQVLECDYEPCGAPAQPVRGGR